MLILGIDPGTLILGYSLIDTGTPAQPLAVPRVEVMDVLYLKRMPDLHLRLRRIFDTTQRIIDSYHPDHLAIEAPFVGKNAQSMIKLGRAQGVAIAAAFSRDLSYTEYEPSVVKQRVTGNGTASKEQVATMLQSIFGIVDRPQYLDASDALAVAYACHLEMADPLGDLRKELRPARAHKSRKQQWADFVNQNPDRLD